MSRKRQFGRFTHPDYTKHFDELFTAADTGKFETIMPLTRRGGFYKNTLLLTSLSFGDTGIALLLILQAETRAAKVFRMHDKFSGSASTPLILAAKTGNTPAALAMIASQHIKSFINEIDYLGNSAMHYACLMRNMDLVNALIEAGADFNQVNHFGFTPEQYLTRELKDNGLEYRYGTHNHGDCAHLCEVSDFGYDFKCDSGYVGTRDHHYTSFRWFIQLIILNLNLANSGQTLTDAREDRNIWVLDHSYDCHVKAEQQPSNQIKDILQARIKSRMPVMDARLYNDCCRLFTGHHHAKHDEALAFCQSTIQIDESPTIIDDYFSSR